MNKKPIYAHQETVDSLIQEFDALNDEFNELLDIDSTEDKLVMLTEKLDFDHLYRMLNATILAVKDIENEYLTWQKQKMKEAQIQKRGEKIAEIATRMLDGKLTLVDIENVINSYNETHDKAQIGYQITTTTSTKDEPVCVNHCCKEQQKNDKPDIKIKIISEDTDDYDKIMNYIKKIMKD